MTMTRRLGRNLLVGSLAFLVALGFAGASTARAEQVIFTIDPLLSTASWSGTQGTATGGGAWLEQSSGSLSAALSGHFLVDFDPLHGNPTSMQFVGDHGYYQVASPHLLSPASGGGPGAPALANFGGKSTDGSMVWAIRDLSWDFSSAPIGISSGAFPANQSTFKTLSGRIDSSTDSDSYVGATDVMSGGSWTLSESSLGSGNWTLSTAPASPVYYTYGTSFAAYDDTGSSLTGAGTVVATAHFGAANVSPPIAPPPIGQTVQADGLGGATVTGGVSASFGDTISTGSLTVQQVFTTDALSQGAVEAAKNNSIFAASTADLAAAPQIWDVSFTGALNGGTATLVFNYDPGLLPLGFDQSTLGIWHYSHQRLQWEFGGTVNIGDHTITYITDGFSDYMLGTTAVPEPSTICLAMVGVVGLAAAQWRRRGRQARVVATT